MLQQLKPQINLGCVLLWYLLSKETEPMLDDRWTLFRWCTERKSSQKETRETCPYGDQGCLIRKTGDWIFFQSIYSQSDLYICRGKE